MSQLLERLTRDLDGATEPISRAEISTRIACNLARLGRFVEARQVVGSVRQQFGRGQSGRVTVWLMLAEGLIFHYEELSPAALERIRGAQVLSLAMGYSTIVALASAWKAHIEFERSEYASMVESLQIGFKHVGPQEFDARTRLAAVLSNSFLISGDRDQGQYWFKRGHDYAVRNGDQASIDALLYNRAAFQVARLRVLNCARAVDPSELAAARMEVASARNLQRLLRVSALVAHVRLLEARLQMVELKFESAILDLRDIRGAAPFAPHNFDQRLVELEISFCHLMLGRKEDALAHFSGAELLGVTGLDLDERVVATWMCSKMAASDARFGVELDYVGEFERLWLEYGNGCANLRAMLEPFSHGEGDLSGGLVQAAQ